MLSISVYPKNKLHYKLEELTDTLLDLYTERKLLRNMLAH